MKRIFFNRNIKFKVPAAIFLVWLFHVSAILGILLADKTTWFISKTPLNLLLCFFLLIWVFPIKTKKEIGLLLLFIVMGILAEIIGVQTGILFGSYSYGENLGLKFFGVPFIIGINWAILTFITGNIAHKWFAPFFRLKIVTGVALMLLLDVLLEGVAPKFDFWAFQGGKAPLFNYLTWGALAALMQWIFHSLKIKGNYPFSMHLYLVQFLFFLILNFSLPD